MLFEDGNVVGFPASSDFVIFGATLEKYRVLAVGVGLVLFLGAGRQASELGAPIGIEKVTDPVSNRPSTMGTAPLVISTRRCRIAATPLAKK